MYTSICLYMYLRVLLVLHRPDVVDIGVNTILKNMPVPKGLNAHINRHAHTEYLKMIEVYSPFGIWHVFL